MLSLCVPSLPTPGREHLSNIKLHPGASVVAFADRSPESCNAARALLGESSDAECYADYRDVLARDDIDIIIIATPNYSHIDVLRDAIPTQKHILCEKPLCTTIEHCWEVLALHDAQPAATRGLLWVGMEYRYMAPLQRIAKELSAGTVGDLRMLTLREHRFPFLVKVDNWNRFNTNTGGTLVEKACHFFDLISYLNNLAPKPGRARALPVGVVAMGGQAVNHLDEVYEDEEADDHPAPRRPDILDHAYVLVEFDNGARACLEMSMFAEASEHQLEVSAVGDAGKLEAFMPGHGDKHVDHTETNVRISRRSEELRSRAWRSSRPPPPEATKGRVKHVAAHPDARIVAAGDHHGSTFVELDWLMHSVRAGASEPHVSIADSVLAIAIGIAAHRSIDTKTRVAMTDVVDMNRITVLLAEHDRAIKDQ
mmetsp:Transcript_25847/g.69813  ORF Transcript_25847/g.69813 Transcript_25847/m.69813 type:complete len:425 (-) Transcript_25847:441-1715(-)